MRFPTPYFSSDLLCDLTSSLKIARMFFSSKIHNIGYTLLKQTPWKLLAPETLKKKFAVVSLKTKQLATVIKVVRNQEYLEGIFQFWENHTLEHSVLKKIKVRTPTTIK